MAQRVVCFSHGQESGPWGSKIRYMADIARERGFAVESVDYQGIADPDERVEKLVAEAPSDAEPLVLVGSSMGAYVATVASARLDCRALFLLAPAVFLDDCGRQDPVPRADHVTVVHGWHDDVVPVSNAIAFAQRYAAALHVLNADHRLIEALPIIGELFGAFLDRLAPS